MRFHRATLLLIITVMLAMPGCKESAAPQDGPEKPVVTGQKALSYEPYDKIESEKVYEGEPVAWFDDNPVFRDELERFGKKQTNRIHNKKVPHSGDLGPVPVSEDFGGLLDTYLDYRMMVREAFLKNLQDKEKAREYNHLLNLYVRAQDYRAHLKDQAPISAEMVKSKLPEEWVQMNFAMKVFPSLEEAHRARAAIGSRSDYLSLKDGFSRNVEKSEIGQTGLVWRGSGFFNKVDEGFLFQLDEGEISDPVESGLGLTLCLVLERRDYSEEAQYEYITKIRKDLTANYLEGVVKKMNREGPYEMDRRTLNLLFGEGQGPEPGEEELPIFTLEGAPVSLKSVTRVFPLNFRFMMATQEPEAWVSYAEAALRKIAVEFSLGLEADKLDIPLSLPAQISLKENNESFLVGLFKETVFMELAEKGVTKDETNTYYKGNKDKFQAADTIFVSYYFSPYLGVMQPLAERVNAGSTPFEELAVEVANINRSGEDVPKELANLHTSDEVFKRKVIVKGEGTFSEFQRVLFKMREGSVRVLRSDLGEFLFRIDGTKDGGTVPFDDSVHNTIASYLVQKKVDARMDAIAAERRKDVSIRFEDDWQDIKGEPVTGTEDFG